MPESDRRRPKQARSRVTVDAILEAAAEVLAEEGPEGATTNRIAERAGVSIGTLYQYFANKKALYQALGDRFAEGMRRSVLDLAPIIAEGNNLRTVLQRSLDTLLGGVMADPVLHGMLHVTALPPRDFEVIDAFERELAVSVAALIRIHPLLRERSTDPDLDARFLVRAAAGAMSRTLSIEPELVATPAFRDALVRLIDGYFGGVIGAG